jgi:hypothetical protein
MNSTADTQDNSRNHTARISTVQRSLNKEGSTGGHEEVQRRSRRPNEEETRCSAKLSGDIVRVLEVKLTQCQQELQAQGSRHKKLKHDFDKLLAENDHLRNDYDNLSKYSVSQKFCQDRYDYTVKQLLLPYTQEKGLQFDDRTDEAFDFVLNPLLQDAQEAGALRVQVQTLQNELLKREKKIAAISDEQFASDFFKLAAQIKTLSRLLRPNEEIDVLETLGPCIMTSGVAPHHWSGRVGRKLFIEAWTWSALIRMIFMTPFTIFGMESSSLTNLWSNMFGTQHYYSWPLPTPPCESWRHMTMEQLIAIVNEDIVTHGKTKNDYGYLEQCVLNARAVAMGNLQTTLALIEPAIESSHILQIVNMAFTLAMHMSLQRSRFQITFPNVGDRFNDTEMKSTLVEDDPQHGTVVSIINPGLRKWGDMHGKMLDHCYDIVPALVQIQSSELK